MTTWNNSGMELNILVLDERPLIPQVTVEIIATGEKVTYGMGELRSQRGDADIYRNADRIIRSEEHD